jgi:hypothetical protein
LDPVDHPNAFPALLRELLPDLPELDDQTPLLLPLLLFALLLPLLCFPCLPLLLEDDLLRLPLLLSRLFISMSSEEEDTSWLKST